MYDKPSGSHKCLSEVDGKHESRLMVGMVEQIDTECSMTFWMFCHIVANVDYRNENKMVSSRLEQIRSGELQLTWKKFAVN